MSSDVTLRYLLFGEDRSASKTVDNVGHKAHSMAASVGGAFSKLGGTIGGEVGELLSRLGEGLEKVGEHGLSAGQKLTVAGGALTGLGAAFQMVGSKDKQAADQLKAAIDATGASVGDFHEEIEKTVGHMENLDHGAADTQQALAGLTEATQDPKKALDEMGLVADLAAAKHISLSDASSLVAKALNGNTRLFKQYGVELQKNKDGTTDVDGALSQLSEHLSGQAAASVDNFSSKVDVVKTKVEDWAAGVGQKLGPVMTALGPTLMIVGSAMEIMRARQEAAAAATVVETTATEAQGVAARGTAAAQALLNAVMDANPIVLVGIAIAALVAGFILAWQHSETFRNIVKGAFDAVSGAASAMWDDVLKPTFKFIVDAFLAVAGAIVHGAADAFGWVPGIGGKLKAAAKHFDEFRDSINNSLDGIHNNVDVNITAHVSTFTTRSTDDAGGTHVSSTKAKFATGGLVTGGIPGRDSVPSLLTPGEFVVTPDGSNLHIVGGQGGGNTYIIQAGALTSDGAREIDRSLRNLHSQTAGALGY